MMIGRCLDCARMKSIAWSVRLLTYCNCAVYPRIYSCLDIELSSHDPSASVIGPRGYTASPPGPNTNGGCGARTWAKTNFLNGSRATESRLSKTPTRCLLCASY